jgi:transposase
MIQITPQMKVFVALEPVDFRCGIDGLARLCRSQLGADPFGGAVFVFRSKRGTGIKILCHDGSGFWLCQKRLSMGRFTWWPSARNENEASVRLLVHELQVLIWGGDPTGARVPEAWRPVG